MESYGHSCVTVELIRGLHIGTHSMMSFISKASSDRVLPRRMGKTQQRSSRTRSFMVAGLSTPCSVLCLICKICSELNGQIGLYQKILQFLAARSFLVAGFNNRWFPRKFPCGVANMLVLCKYAMSSPRDLNFLKTRSRLSKQMKLETVF